jgi:hypothetical protein
VSSSSPMRREQRDGRQMGSGGKQPLVQLLAIGAAHLRCYVCRRKRAEDERAKVDEEEARHEIHRQSPKRPAPQGISAQGRLAANSRALEVQKFVRLSESFRQCGYPNGGRHAAVWRQAASFRTCVAPLHYWRVDRPRSPGR